MADILRIDDPDRALTTHRVVGEISLPESLDYTEHYNASGAAFRTLWDLTDGRLPDASGISLTHVSLDHARNMAVVLERPDRFVALASPVLRDYAILRAWAVYAASASPGIQWRAFRSVEDALAWLLAQPGP